MFKVGRMRGGTDNGESSRLIHLECQGAVLRQEPSGPRTEDGEPDLRHSTCPGGADLQSPRRLHQLTSSPCNLSVPYLVNIFRLYVYTLC